MTKFPIGGPKKAVYDYLQEKGFVMGKNDKEWTRGEYKAMLYGAGSRLLIRGPDGEVVVDDDIEVALARLPDRSL